MTVGTSKPSPQAGGKDRRTSLDILTQTQRRALRDTTGVAIVDDD